MQKATGPTTRNLKGVYAYDLDKAKELMAKSNFPDGFTFDMPSIPIYQSRLEALAGFFREIGITMNIAPVEPGTLARRSRTTDFPATNLVWNTNTDPKFLALRYIYEDAAYNPFKTKPSDELLALAQAGLESVGYRRARRRSTRRWRRSWPTRHS